MLFSYNIYLINSHPKSRVHIGHQPRSRNGQPIDRAIRFHRTLACRPHRSWSGPHSRNPSLPIHQHHPTTLRHSAAAQPVDIHPRSYGSPRRIRSIPLRRMHPRRLFRIHQRRQTLPQQVKHLQPHMGRCRQLVGYDRGRIERIGVILPQGKMSRQSRPPSRRKRSQRQREMPTLVRGRADEPAQIGPIKQPHLHPSRGLPGRQPHPTFKERFCADANAQHQPDETDDKRLHRSYSLYSDVM